MFRALPWYIDICCNKLTQYKHYAEKEIADFYVVWHL